MLSFYITVNDFRCNSGKSSCLIKHKSKYARTPVNIWVILCLKNKNKRDQKTDGIISLLELRPIIHAPGTLISTQSQCYQSWEAKDWLNLEICQIQIQLANKQT